VRPLVVSYAAAALITSPFLAYALLHLQHGALHPVGEYPADLLNFVIPTHLTALGWGWTRSIAGNFRGNTSEQGAYLGLAWLAILAWFAWSFRRAAAARFLLAALVVGIVAELGIRLNVNGRDSITLPWRLLSTQPLFENILPVRISMFVALAASVCVAWWASSRRAPRAFRIVLPALAIATVVPSLWLNVWHERPSRPAFFTQGVYRTCLGPNDVVLMLPFPSKSDAMLWQAETGFAYRMANGYVGPRAPKGVPDPGLVRSLQGRTVPTDPQPLLAWARSQGVTTIVVAGEGARAWVHLLSASEHPRRVGGVYLFELHGRRSPACGAASLGGHAR
jgi:hypothetical protein